MQGGGAVFTTAATVAAAAAAAETEAPGTPRRAAGAPLPPVLFCHHLHLGLCQATNNPQTACKVSITVLAVGCGCDFAGGHPSGTSGVRGGPKY